MADWYQVRFVVGDEHVSVDFEFHDNAVRFANAIDGNGYNPAVYDMFDRDSEGAPRLVWGGSE